MSRLIIKCTWGPERKETLFQAFTVANAAIASGVSVTMYLTGEASWVGVTGTQDEELAHSVPLSTLVETVRQEGKIFICAQCAQRRDIDPSQLLPGVEIAGAASFVADSLQPDTQALVY